MSFDASKEKAAIRTKLQLSLTLLDKEKHEEFLKLMAKPSKIATLKASNKYEKAVNQFKSKKKDQMKTLIIELLNSGLEIEFSQDRSQAYYILPKSRRRYATFTKEGGEWYIENT